MISICLVLISVYCDYPPFKIVERFHDHGKEVTLFRRSGDRCCYKYFNNSNPEVALFLREKQWIINTNITKLDQSSCPRFRYFTKNTLVDKIDFQAKNIEFCTPLANYAVFDKKYITRLPASRSSSVGPEDCFSFCHPKVKGGGGSVI